MWLCYCIRLMSLVCQTSGMRLKLGGKPDEYFKVTVADFIEMCVCLYVCVFVRERARVCVGACVCMCACV